MQNKAIFYNFLISTTLLLKLVSSQGNSIACDFEASNFCGWTQEQYDEVDWSIGQGPTPSKDTGPSFDHTYGQYGDTNGKYMYLEATNLNRRDIASLRSPPIRLIYSPNYCFSFWYHMYGEGTGVLAAVIKQEIIWVQKNEIGNFWRKANIDLNSTITKKGGIVVIQLIAIRGMNFKSDMAIDDIKLTRGRCETESEAQQDIEDHKRGFTGSQGYDRDSYDFSDDDEDQPQSSLNNGQSQNNFFRQAPGNNNNFRPSAQPKTSSSSYKRPITSTHSGKFQTAGGAGAGSKMSQSSQNNAKTKTGFKTGGGKYGKFAGKYGKYGKYGGNAKMGGFKRPVQRTGGNMGGYGYGKGNG